MPNTWIQEPFRRRPNDVGLSLRMPRSSPNRRRASPIGLGVTSYDTETHRKLADGEWVTSRDAYKQLGWARATFGYRTRKHGIRPVKVVDGIGKHGGHMWDKHTLQQLADLYPPTA